MVNRVIMDFEKVLYYLVWGRQDNQDVTASPAFLSFKPSCRWCPFLWRYHFIENVVADSSWQIAWSDIVNMVLHMSIQLFIYRAPKSYIINQIDDIYRFWLVHEIIKVNCICIFVFIGLTILRFIIKYILFLLVLDIFDLFKKTFAQVFLQKRCLLLT